MKKSKELTPWQVWIAKPEAIDELCDAIMDGKSITAIAEAKGAANSMLVRWIAADEHRSARAREARIASAQTFDDQALAAIRAASDPFQLSMAKEEAHHLRWRASKISPSYADKLRHGGDDDLPPIGVTLIERRIVKPSD